MFRDKFWLSLLLSVPVLIWSPMLQDLLGYAAPEVPGASLIPMVFGTAVFVYGGWPFLQGGRREIRSRRPGMMLLISLAIAVAFISSLASEVEWLDLEFWWELVLLIDVMLLGHWQEMKALGQASSALDALAALIPDLAERVEDDGIHEVAVGDLLPGNPGVGPARWPNPRRRRGGTGRSRCGRVHGHRRITAGRARCRRPSRGGTVATDSSIRVRVQAVGEDTAIAGIRRLVADAQASKSRAQALADRAAALLFYVALGSAVMTFAAWAGIGRLDDAIERTVTVLVIACPHALGLAIPLVIAISTSVSAKAGILVKDRLALERMRLVDAVLFDKTGTLTRGEPVVSGVATTAGVDGDTVLRLAAAVEADSEHPLARAIVAAALPVGGVPVAAGFRSMTGRGVQASVDGATVAVGGPALLSEALDRSTTRARGHGLLVARPGCGDPERGPGRNRDRSDRAGERSAPGVTSCR